MEIKTVQKARTFLLIGLFGGVLTLIGDLLIGYVRFPDRCTSAMENTSHRKIWCKLVLDRMC